jgi:hypothetical protein
MCVCACVSVCVCVCLCVLCVCAYVRANVQTGRAVADGSADGWTARQRRCRSRRTACGPSKTRTPPSLCCCTASSPFRSGRPARPRPAARPSMHSSARSFPRARPQTSRSRCASLSRVRICEWHGRASCSGSGHANMELFACSFRPRQQRTNRLRRSTWACTAACARGRAARHGRPPRHA